MIVIPTYNERENIKLIIKKIRSLLVDIPILFIDDNSPDGTAEEIKKIQKEQSGILLMERKGQYGLGTAYKEAFLKIIKENLTNFIISFDADLSHPTEALPQIIKELKNSGVVVGSRYIKYGKTENWGFFRKITSYLGNVYIRLLTGVKTRDITSGFVGYRISELKKIDFNKIESKGYSFQIEIKYLLDKSGASFEEIPITFSERKVGQSKFNLKILLEGVMCPIKLFLKNLNLLSKRFKILSSSFIFLTTFLLYAFTAPHTIFLGDSAEFVSAVKTLGVTHPPGYSLYVLMAKLFSSVIPLDSLAFRVSLFSALCASVSLILFYIVELKLLSRLSAYFRFDLRHEKIFVFVAFLTTFLLATSDTFWSQAIYAKVYSLNFLIFISVLWLVLEYLEKNNSKYLFWASFLYGLGIVNHQSLLLFLPFFILTIWSKPKNISAPHILKCIIFFVLGLSGYLLSPIFSYLNPSLDWGQTSTSLDNFLNHISRSSYNDYFLGSRLPQKLDLFWNFWFKLWEQFKFLTIFIPAGIWSIFKTYRKILWILVGTLFFNSLGIILIRNVGYSQMSSEVFSFYYLPAYGVSALLISIGIVFIYNLLDKNKSFPQSIKPLIILLLILSTISVAKTNYKRNDLSKFSFIEDYSKAVLESLESNAILIVSTHDNISDTLNFSLLYSQTVLNIRPDVKIVGYPEIFKTRDREELLQIYKSKTQKDILVGLLKYSVRIANSYRPIYTTFTIDFAENDLGIYSKCEGFAFRLDKSPKKTTAISGLTDSFLISPDDLQILNNSYFGKSFVNYTNKIRTYCKGKS